MGQTVALIKLAAMIRPHARGALQALGGRPPFVVDTMLRIHCLQLRWNLSDPPMEEACTSIRWTASSLASLACPAFPTSRLSCAFGTC